MLGWTIEEEHGWDNLFVLRPDCCEVKRQPEEMVQRRRQRDALVRQHVAPGLKARTMHVVRCAVWEALWNLSKLKPAS
eukprot:scaffold669842_cov57-Prasinocladus_malaysianus.AAC.1